MYIAYYYNSSKDQFAGDANELFLCGNFFSYITEVRTSDNISKLEPTSETGELVFLCDTETASKHAFNYNPCPEEL